MLILFIVIFAYIVTYYDANTVNTIYYPQENMHFQFSFNFPTFGGIKLKYMLVLSYSGDTEECREKNRLPK